jgi:hypothetical protein
VFAVPETPSERDDHLVVVFWIADFHRKSEDVHRLLFLQYYSTISQVFQAYTYWFRDDSLRDSKVWHLDPNVLIGRSVLRVTERHDLIGRVGAANCESPIAIQGYVLIGRSTASHTPKRVAIASQRIRFDWSIAYRESKDTI